MTPALLVGIAGLAFLDSFNPATLVAVTLILLTPGHHPVAKALAFVCGAFATVALIGAAVFLAADQAASAVESGLVWLRRIAFGAAALGLLVAGVRRLRPSRRRRVELPGWFTPLTAVPLGAVMTGADLPNAFPYFIAIERLVAAGVTQLDGLLVITGYAVVYCVPCLVLLALGMRQGDRVRARLRGLYERFGTEATVPARPATASALIAAGLGLLWVAGTV